MRYLIDGHNLIPQLGLDLRSMDDELQLVAILQEFCRIHRHQAEVYFDGAPPGQDGPRRFGPLTAHFVRQGTSADDAIRVRLGKLGRAAKNWVVVSSDRQVQAEARAAQARVVDGSRFAQQVRAVKPSAAAVEPEPSPEEVDEWLTIFTTRGRTGKS
jgi:uncharacterized protein